MAYRLTQAHLDIINQNLPPQFAALKDQYPSTIFNAADHWDKPKFPQGYVPKRLSIYYEESAKRPAISWQYGKLRYVTVEEIPVDPDVTQVMVDCIWTYIRVRHHVILDRTEGVQFPPELSHQELMLRQIIQQIRSGNFREFQG